MKTRSKKFNLTLILFLIPLLSGCVTIYNPATQKKEILLINTQTEVALGKDMNKEMQQKIKILNDPILKMRLENIGDKIAKASDRLDLVYTFYVVKDTELNAFTIPGGFIYVNSGLMKVATNDELACVLAHEIGHTAARHTVKKLQTALGYQLISGIAQGTTGQKTMSDAMNIIFNLISFGYSRQDEFLADSLSVRYAKKAGFNPYGMVSFFEKLKSNTETKGSHYQIVFLSSHPPITDRITNVYKEIEAIKTNPITNIKTAK